MSVSTGIVTAAEAIDPSGGDVSGRWAAGLYVGGAGTVKVDLVNSTGVSFTAVAGGYILADVTKVYQTGTTATGIVGLGW